MRPSGAFARQRPAGSWFNLQRAKSNESDSDIAVVDIYDEIGYFGVSAKDFSRQLADLDVATLYLNVNSPGGDVYDGIAILNALRAHPAKVVATVTGIAASAASFLIMGADEVIMARNSELMIHDAWGMALGNAGDLHALADRLDKASDNIASIYAERAGGTTDEWRAAMRAESWYSADEAVEAGLADRVHAAKKAKDEAKDRFDLSVFAHAGRAAAPRPFIPAARLRASDEPICTECGNDLATEGHALCSECLESTPDSPSMPPAEQAETPPPTTEGVPMTDTLVSGLRARLGIPAETNLDESGVFAALDEALAERATPTATIENRVPPGTVLVDEAEYADLQAAAREGREARQRQIADDRASTVENAVREGRIPPSRREHWLNQLAADPGAADVLQSLAKNLVPLVETGYTGGVDEATSDDDAVYNRLFSKEA